MLHTQVLHNQQDDVWMFGFWLNMYGIPSSDGNLAGSIYDEYFSRDILCGTIEIDLGRCVQVHTE